MFMPDEDDDGDSMGGGSMSSDGRVSTEVLLVKGSKTGAQGTSVRQSRPCCVGGRKPYKAHAMAWCTPQASSSTPADARPAQSGTASSGHPCPRMLRRLSTSRTCWPHRGSRCDSMPACTAGRLWAHASALRSLHTRASCRYVVSALPRSVEVHNTLTMSSAQSIPLPGAVCVLGFQAAASSGGGGHGSGAGAGAGAGAGGGGGASAGPEHLLVVCPNDLFVLRMVPLVMQVADLVSRRPPEFEEALALCEHCRGDGVRVAAMGWTYVPRIG